MGIKDETDERPSNIGPAKGTDLQGAPCPPHRR